MPVIVLAVNNGKVLLASGGKWYRDGKSKKEQGVIALEQRTTAATKDDAIADLVATVRDGVRIGPVVKKNDYWTTRLIDPSVPGNPWGFIKGTFPDKNYPKESAEAAARREFEEETSTPLTEPLTKVATNIFRVDLSDATAQAVIKNWEGKVKERYGELVKLEWVPIANVQAASDELNPESRDAVQYLPMPGGGRTRRVFSGGQNKMATTRSMTRRKTRRSKSHCVGIKRSAVCKRTQGCKQAVGTKRRFCRTAKNRKH